MAQQMKVCFKCVVCGKVFYYKGGKPVTADEFAILDDEYLTDYQEFYCAECVSIHIRGGQNG